jgi:hypothetical protein
MLCCLQHPFADIAGMQVDRYAPLQANSDAISAAPEQTHRVGHARPHASYMIRPKTWSTRLREHSPLQLYACASTNPGLMRGNRKVLQDGQAAALQ